MRIVVMNTGSSTLKFSLVDVDTSAQNSTGHTDYDVRKLAQGSISRIGQTGKEAQSAIFEFGPIDTSPVRKQVPVKDYQEATASAIEALQSAFGNPHSAL